MSQHFSRSSTGKPLRVVLKYKKIQVQMESEPKTLDQILALASQSIQALDIDKITIRTQGGDRIINDEELVMTLKAAKSLGKQQVKLMIDTESVNFYPDAPETDRSISDVILLEENGRNSKLIQSEPRIEACNEELKHDSKDMFFANPANDDFEKISHGDMKHCETELKNCQQYPEMNQPQGSLFGKDVQMKGISKQDQDDDDDDDDSSSESSGGEDNDEEKIPEEKKQEKPQNFWDQLKDCDHHDENAYHHHKHKHHKKHHHHKHHKHHDEWAPKHLLKNIRKMIDEIAPGAFFDCFEQHNEQNNNGEQKVYHQDVTCDNCEQHPIAGIRYKCSVCSNYDLCENCENLNVHSTHALIKIKTPQQAPTFFQAQYPAPQTEQQSQPQQQQWQQQQQWNSNPWWNHHGGWGQNCGQNWGQQWRGWRGNNYCGRGGFGRGGCHWGRGGGFKPILKKFAQNFGPVIQQFIQKAGGENNTECENEGESKFPKMVVPVTKKEKVFAAPNQMIIQRIRVQNKSSHYWPQPVIIKPLYNGDVKIDSQITFPDNLKPGEEGDIVIPLQVPGKAGKYKVVFGLIAPNGERIGKRIVIKINVIDEQSEVEQKQKAEMMKKAAELSKEGHNFWKAYNALKNNNGDIELARESMKKEE